MQASAASSCPEEVNCCGWWSQVEVVPCLQHSGLSDPSPAESQMDADRNWGEAKRCSRKQEYRSHSVMLLFFFLYSKERVQFSRFVKAGERIAWFSQCSLTLTHTAHLTPSLERFLWPWLPCFCFCLCLLIREQFHFKTLGALFREILSFFLLQSFSFLLCFTSVGRKKRRQIHL